MKRAFHSLVLLLMLSVSAFAQNNPVPQLMNFQGRLAKPDGTPVPNGNYSIRFSLHTALTGGTEKWNQTINPVTVRNGVFAVALDTSSGASDKFQGNLFLEIKIGTDAPLTPRQQLASVAYAMKAESVKDNSITSNSIVNGSITAADLVAGTLNPLAWLLNGNANPPANSFLGTTTNHPLTIKVNNQRVMQYTYVEDVSDPNPQFQHRTVNVLGGAEINSIAPGILGATIVGGGDDWFGDPQFDNPNMVTDNFGTVVGGSLNTANGFAFVGGGYNNKATEFYATIVGGTFNQATNNQTFIGGGIGNTASGFGATVPGGSQNAASGSSATVTGGQTNLASGSHSTVPGGANNTAAGDFSFAAGRRAKANHTSAFVWADNTAADFASTGPQQFLIRASNGVGINTNAPGRALLNVRGGITDVAIFGGTLAPVGAATFESNRPVSASYHLAMCNNGVDVFYVDGNGRPHGTGSYVNLSDARFKKNVVPVENALDAILNLRGVTFEWDTEKWKERGLPSGRQIGFLAQEVEKVLPELVTTDAKGVKMVSYTDAVPVLVEAVKTLKKESDRKDTRISELETRLAAIEAALAEMKTNHK